jgi:DNA-binding CsgD family transcriptional regulator
MEELTKKEKEIYLAICEEGIIEFEDLAKKFFIEVSTIKTHYNVIRQKFLCKNRAELIFQYYKNKEKERETEEVKEEVVQENEDIEPIEWVLC